MTDTYTPVGPYRADEDKMVAAMLLALSQHGEGVPTDIQELLLRGNPQHGVPPGALSAALKAALNAAETPPALRKLKPLAWISAEGWTEVANTPFGKYEVKKGVDGTWVVYDFGNRHF